MLDQKESELLSAYVDNELSAVELNHVQQQLTRSREWREELDLLQKTKNITHRLLDSLHQNKGDRKTAGSLLSRFVK